MNDRRRAILAALDESPHTGPELAARLEVSRTAVWKHVESLRSEGFEIVASEAGYRLTGIPEYSGAAIDYHRDSTEADRRIDDIEFHDALDSTNERARELAREGVSEAGVVAETQTAGRGRRGRDWASPRGGIWLSVLLRPDLPPARVPLLTLGAGVAVVRACTAAGVHVRLKWPNDVLSEESGEERKLAGILTEMEGETDRVSWVIVGLGLNANVESRSLPETATSLQTISGQIDRAEFVASFLSAFESLREHPDEILPAWREHASTLGRVVRIESGGDEIVGEAVDIADPGRLCIDTDAGRVWVHAGDCRHLRPIEE